MTRIAGQSRASAEVLMILQLIDISVRDKQAHPRLDGRMTGHVRAVLRENRDGEEQLHELVIPVWAEIDGAMSESDIDMALMLRAARIIERVRTRLGAQARD